MTTVVHDRISYIAIDDLARVVSARTFANPVLKKVELILPSVRFKCTAESPFVVVTRVPDGTQSVAQLMSPVRYSNGIFMVPASEFLFLYQLHAQQKILFTSQGAAAASEAPKPAVVTPKPAVETPKAGSEMPKEQSFTPQQQLSLGSADKNTKYSITGIDVEEKRNGYLLRIHASERLPDPEKVLQGGQWLYLTLPKAKGNVSVLGGMFSSGIVRRVIPLQSASALQLSFQLREKMESAEIVPDPEGTDILVALRPAAKKQVDASGQAAEGASAPSAAEKNAARQKNKWKLDVIVLDAGHGGHDPGTIGTIGTHEADVTLGIALKLGKMIEKNMPDVKVVYTRKTDTFVELYRRGQIANEAGGKLFISIHCNSTPKKATAANGFEIYLLRPGKTENAIEIAERENAVVRLEKDYENRYQKLTEENFIILTMAQSAFVKQSERFAELLESEMAKKMVYQSRGVKQAGFYVLVGASMPNILVETGYLSNRKDETLLRGMAGQYLAAESIFDGLKKFKAEYEGTFSQY
ncbi:MAG: N-acetylmuramoyl-L-alanine amidase family protein [Acidobacteriota bacterium]